MQKTIIRVAIEVGIILLIPLFGNFFIEGWNWGVLDFVAMGLLLFIAGLAIDIAIRKFKNKPLYQVIAVLAILAILVLIWVELAVDAVSQFLETLTK